MRLGRLIPLLPIAVFLLCTLAAAAPVDDVKEVESVKEVEIKDDGAAVVTTVEPVTEVPTGEPEDVPTTIVPETDDVGGDDERKARQLDEDEDEDDDDADHEDDDDDDEEEEDADEEEEEEERKLAGSRVNAKPVSKKKVSQVERKNKPVPVLVEGVEDDEAEDLGIFEREDSKNGSNEKSDEEKSDEEKADDDNEDEDDDEEDDDESSEDDDDQHEETGLVDEPSSSERGDVEDVVSVPVETSDSGVQEPLAIAVVQPEVEVSDPVVPIIVEESNKNSVSGQSGKKVEKQRKNKPKKEEEDDEEDEDDEDDDEEEDDDEDKKRSEKIQARSAYPSSPVLYYYPFPESQAEQ